MKDCLLPLFLAHNHVLAVNQKSLRHFDRLHSLHPTQNTYFHVIPLITDKMRYTAAAVAMAGLAAASWSPDAGSRGAAPPANGTWADAYTTEVVTAFTTYCPKATEITLGSVTYSVTEATTLVRIDQS